MIKRGILIAVLIALAVIIMGCQAETESPKEQGEAQIVTDYTTIDIALKHCRNYADFCFNCSFKISDLNLNQLIEKGFNCTTSENPAIYSYDPCFCESIICEPEKTRTYYIIGSDLEAVFSIKPYSRIIGNQSSLAVENLCLVNSKERLKQDRINK